MDLWVNKGDMINGFTGANEAIGTLELKFEDSSALESVLSDYTKYIKIN